MKFEDAIRSIDLYLEHGAPPGSFIEACLRSDLLGAYGAADETSREIIPELARHIYNHVPRGAIRESVDQWLSSEIYRTETYRAWRLIHAR